MIVEVPKTAMTHRMHYLSHESWYDPVKERALEMQRLSGPERAA
jgi:hypothetical protein